MADIEMFEEPGTSENIFGKDWHDIVGEINLLQSVGDPFVFREHLPRHKRNVVETQIQLEWKIGQKRRTCKQNILFVVMPALRQSLEQHLAIGNFPLEHNIHFLNELCLAAHLESLKRVFVILP